MSDVLPQGDRPGLGPPRFGLRTLLVLVTTFCLILASYTWFGAYGATWATLFALAVMAHVAGNWLGTQLRSLGDQRLPPGAEQGDGLAAIHTPLQAEHFAPPSHLNRRSPLPRFVLVAVLIGTLVGIAGGAVLVWWVNDSRATWFDISCGALAFGVLGGLGTFGVAAFLQAGWRALSQATRDEPPLF
jgi:hypothetical protein